MKEDRKIQRQVGRNRKTLRQKETETGRRRDTETVRHRDSEIQRQ